MKTKIVGKIISVKRKSVQLKIANDNTFIVKFAINDYEMYLQQIEKQLQFSFNSSMSMT